MGKLQKSQNGFSAVEALLVFVIVVIIGGTGWYVYNAAKTTNHIYSSGASSQTIVVSSPYSNAAQSAFKAELSTLNSPLTTFGIKNGAPAKCIKERIYQYDKPQLQCSVSEDPYVVIGTNQDTKAHFVAQAAALDTLLKENGWTETSNATPTIEAWFAGITSGKDWYPDEGAFKNIGTSHCSMDFFLAFSNPRPPAFHLQTSCTSPILQKYKNELL